MFEIIKNIFKRKTPIDIEKFNTKILNLVQINYLLQTGKEVVGFKVNIENGDYFIIFSLREVDDHYVMRYQSQNSKETKVTEFNIFELSKVEVIINVIKEETEFQNSKFKFGVIKGE